MKLTGWVVTALLAMSLLQGCSEEKAKDEAKETKPVVEKKESDKIVEQEVPVVEEVVQESDPEEEVEGVNTDAFIYATNVDVTDARDISKHLDLVVHMSSELTPALATQHVILQSYEFLQQEDIKGADSITIGVMNGDFRVAQYTVDMNKFEPNGNLVESVLQASTIDKKDPKVDEYGKALEWW